jgi:cholesterol transport system auxiliary component
MKPIVKHFRAGLIVILVMTLSACFSMGSNDISPAETQYYILSTDRGHVASHFVENRVLLIKPVRVTSQYRGKNIVTKIGENEYQPMLGQTFFSTPDMMFTEELKRWLQKTGLFSVVTTDETQAADMILETAVTGFYGETREQFSPKSVLEMQFFLMDSATHSQAPLFQTGLNVEVDVNDASASEFVKGWKTGLYELFATLEDDLSGYFSKRDP